MQILYEATIEIDNYLDEVGQDLKDEITSRRVRLTAFFDGTKALYDKFSTKCNHWIVIARTKMPTNRYGINIKSSEKLLNDENWHFNSSQYNTDLFHSRFQERFAQFFHKDVMISSI